MSAEKRFRIVVTAPTADAWQVTVSCDEDAGFATIERPMPRQTGGGGSLPAVTDGDLPADGPLRRLCSGEEPALVDKTLRRLSNRTPDEGDVALFGRYLFTCLLGSDWTKIRAASAGVDVVELALSWSCDPATSDLHRLGWEMMHGPDGFLASGRPQRVAITRVVEGAAHEPRAAGSPPKVLFVIGTALSDPQLRPGAELLGLLRDIESGGRSIHSRVLQHASPRKLMEVVKQFEPDVAHFICHGDVEGGKGFLELELDDGDGDGDNRRYASQLLGFLDPNHTGPPSFVVLSACYSASNPKRSGEPMAQRDVAPLAAEMVRGGVSVVVGMTGRVSDLACRLFSRRFGETLVRGESLISAVEEGRRAGFTQGQAPHETVDWAMPAVFLSEGVPPEFVPVTVVDPDPAVELEERIRTFDLDRKPVFCGRHEFFESYYRLIGPDGPSVIAGFSDDPHQEVGRTRLLHALALQALRDGNLPLLVSSRNKDWDAPKDAESLAYKLLRAMMVARDAYDLDEPETSQLMLLSSGGDADAIAADPKLDARVRSELHSPEGKRIGLAAVRAALQKDLRELRREAGLPDHALPIVMLDDVDRYGDLVPGLFDEMLGSYGLGKKKRPVPVVLVFTLGTTQDSFLRTYREKQPKSWIELIPLGQFRDDGEDLLAYHGVLMRPFREKLYEGVSDVPWVFNAGADEDKIKLWKERLRKRLDRLPSDFSGKLFYSIAETAAEDWKVLLRADDEDVLARMREE